MAEFKIPTETVTLPSKGLLYPKESPLSKGEIEMKYMTAREEDILTNVNYIRQGIVLDKLLQSLIVTEINYDDLLVGDKNAILIAARVLGYGKDYDITYADENGIEIKATVDLTTLENKQVDLSKINEKDKLILLLYVIQADNNKITDKYLKLRNTGLTEDMIKTAESMSNKYMFNKIKPKLENKLMKIKAHEEPIMQAMTLKRWNPTGQEMPKELQFNMLSYLQPNAKPTPSGITHDDVMGNAIQYTVDNPKVESSSSSSNTLGGRRKTRRFKKTNRRRTMRKK
jgi:hypothetical protein